MAKSLFPPYILFLCRVVISVVFLLKKKFGALLFLFSCVRMGVFVGFFCCCLFLLYFNQVCDNLKAI